MAPSKQVMSFMAYFKKAAANQKNIETIIKRDEARRAEDKMLKKRNEIIKKMTKDIMAENVAFITDDTKEYIRETVRSHLDSIISIVCLRHGKNEDDNDDDDVVVFEEENDDDADLIAAFLPKDSQTPTDCCLSPSTPTKPSSSCDIPSSPSSSAMASPARVLANRNKVLTWNDRAAVIFLLVHPKLFGRRKDPLKLTEAVTGVARRTLRNWVNVNDKDFVSYAEKWIPFAEAMTWGDIKHKFKKIWIKDLTINDEDDLKGQIGRYQRAARGNQSMTKFLCRGQGLSEAERANCARRDPKNFYDLTLGRKVVRRKDVRMARKFTDQAAFVAFFVKTRWNTGDPVTRSEVKDELRLRDDCQPGSPFYTRHLVSTPCAKSALSGFISRVLARMNFSIRKTTIGQKVPEDWKEKEIANTEAFEVK